MNIPDRPTGDTADARWQWRRTDDGSCTLVETASGEAMHSGCGALAETRHVYVQGSGAGARLQAGLPTRVFELGFGSGMGWLATAEWALQHTTPLVFVGLDRQLPPEAVVRQLGWSDGFKNLALLEATYEWFGQAERCWRAADWRASSQPLPELQLGCVTLRVVLGDAVAWCHQLTDRPDWPDWPDWPSDQRFDAIYFDPFSPQSAPDLWTPQVFGAMRQIANRDGKLASYCVNRRVRDDLAASGWQVTRVAGPPGGKREVLTAQPS